MNLSVRNAACLPTVSEKTIYRGIKQQTIPAYRVRDQYRFDRAEIVEWATYRLLGDGIAIPYVTQLCSTSGSRSVGR